MKNIVQFTCTWYMHNNTYINIYIYTYMLYVIHDLYKVCACGIYVYIRGICIKSEKYAPVWLEKALNSLQKSKKTLALSL